MEATSHQPSVEPVDESTTEATIAETTDPRAARLADYMNEALQATDPLEANLGAVNGDLMFMAHALQQTISECLEEPPESIKAMAEFMPAVDSYLRVSKQISSMSQLVVKLKGANGSGKRP